MLVLTRKVGETIVANGVTYEVLEIRRNCVRVGIKADKSIPVLRGEVEPYTESVPIPAEIQQQIEAVLTQRGFLKDGQIVMPEKEKAA